jgi:acetyltransferase-like isoleucine patch superfamily enzyme
MRQLSKRILRSLVYRFSRSSLFEFLVAEATPLYRQAYNRQLKQRLASCGTDVQFHYPVTIEQPECVHIGNTVSLVAYTHIWGGGGVTIGDGVAIATHVAITSVTHDYTRPDWYTATISKPVVIEDDVWIGSNAVIMPGVTIGRGAVVGAGSIVTSDVAPLAIVVGVPAREIRKRTVCSSEHSSIAEVKYK